MVRLAAFLSLLSAASAASFTAVGIPVSDLTAAADFYTTALNFTLTNIVLEFEGLSERVLKLPGKNSGAALVLMKHTTGPKPPPGGKIVLEVDDVKAAVEKVRAYGKGARVTLEPGSFKLKTGKVLPTAFVKDVDGWDVELNPPGLF